MTSLHMMERRIIHVLEVQKNIHIESTKIVNHYILQHGYCSVQPFTVPSRWVNLETLKESPEIINADKKYFDEALEQLIKSDQVKIKTSSKNTTMVGLK